MRWPTMKSTASGQQTASARQRAVAESHPAGEPLRPLEVGRHLVDLGQLRPLARAAAPGARRRVVRTRTVKACGQRVALEAREQLGQVGRGLQLLAGPARAARSARRPRRDGRAAPAPTRRTSSSVASSARYTFTCGSVSSPPPRRRRCAAATAASTGSAIAMRDHQRPRRALAHGLAREPARARRASAWPCRRSQALMRRGGQRAVARARCAGRRGARGSPRRGSTAAPSRPRWWKETKRSTIARA